jgi:hypothetical protein
MLIIAFRSERKFLGTKLTYSREYIGCEVMTRSAIQTRIPEPRK